MNLWLRVATLHRSNSAGRKRTLRQCSKRVEHGVLGAVVLLCCGRITSGILPFQFNPVEMNKVDMNLWLYENLLTK